MNGHIKSAEKFKAQCSFQYKSFLLKFILDCYFLIWDLTQIPTEIKVIQKFIVQRHSVLVFSAETTNMNNDKPSDEGVFMMQISPRGEDYSHHEFISQWRFFL